jgi:hypothetical protein
MELILVEEPLFEKSRKVACSTDMCFGALENHWMNKNTAMMTILMMMTMMVMMIM